MQAHIFTVKGNWRGNFSKLATVEPAIKKVIDANSWAQQTESSTTTKPIANTSSQSTVAR